MFLIPSSEKLQMGFVHMSTAQGPLVKDDPCMLIWLKSHMFSLSWVHFLLNLWTCTLTCHFMRHNVQQTAIQANWTAATLDGRYLLMMFKVTIRMGKEMAVKWLWTWRTRLLVPDWDFHNISTVADSSTVWTLKKSNIQWVGSSSSSAKVNACDDVRGQRSRWARWLQSRRSADSLKIPLGWTGDTALVLRHPRILGERRKRNWYKFESDSSVVVFIPKDQYHLDEQRTLRILLLIVLISVKWRTA